MRTKHGIKFIQTRQYNFSNKLGIDNILLPNMDFEKYESDMFHIRKKIKRNLDKKVLILVINYYITSLTSTSKNIRYTWEKNLLDEFIKFKNFIYKRQKRVSTKSKFNMDPITHFSGEFILHIQYNYDL